MVADGQFYPIFVSVAICDCYHHTRKKCHVGKLQSTLTRPTTDCLWLLHLLNHENAKTTFGNMTFGQNIYLEIAKTSINMK